MSLRSLTEKSLVDIAAKGKFSIVDGPFGTQLHASEYVIEGVPVVRVINTSYSGQFISSNLVFISEKKAIQLKRSKVIPGDIIVAKTGATIGKSGIFPQILSCGIIASSCIKLTVDREIADYRFVAYLIQSREGQNKIFDAAGGSTRTTINTKPFGAIRFMFPEKSEQTEIADILSTVDRAIEQTEALIAKQQRIKTGLMQDLLTRGIDEHGKLRSERTHKFKDSLCGRIPAEWKCSILSHFVPSAEYGISSSLGEFGKPVLRMNNFFEGEADISDLKYTDQTVPEKLLLCDGDVLFNRTNSWEHVGRTGIWRCQIENATFASYLVRLNPDLERLLPELLNIWLNWEQIQIAMRRFATPAVHQVNINPTNLTAIYAAFPLSMDEQCEIVRRFTNIRKTIGSNVMNLAKLHSLKTALMQDLLTGRKRVTPLLNEKEAACA